MITSLAEYQRWTGDPCGQDSVLVEALAEAQQLVEEYTDRTFEQGTFTETCDLFQNGRIYPKATPVVSSSPGTPDGSAIIVGYGVGWMANINWFFVSARPAVTVTYTGGYTADTMPIRLKKLVARIAYQSRQTAVPAGIVGSPTSISMGDLSLGYGNGGFVAVQDLDTASKRELNYWRRPQIIPQQDRWWLYR